ncbi:MAG: sigma-54-dependent transcriptional regulator [Gammaproteobacteria bacterium]
MKKLLPEQRDFFKQVAALAFVNPFSQAREQADCELLHIAPGSDIERRNAQIQSLLLERFRQLQPLPQFRFADYPPEHREALQYAWLFYRFHEYQERFNRFIDAQAQAGDEPLELPFADELAGDFRRAGFSEADSAKFIALFYQLQRGYYFIGSSVAGACPAVVELRMRLWNNIFTYNPKWYVDYLCGRMEEFSTLLLGATGSGKSLAAHAIGCSGFIPYDSRRRRFQESFMRSFQAINLAQFPVSLLESELFGHKKGAFTGAIDHHQGVFARCSANGAVFIDEIGDIDVPTQVKLLNVMQERIFSPVGSHEKLRFAGRVICATNRDIEQLRRDGLFRDDLYYRLCSDVIVVPGLRQRLQQDPAELGPLIAGLLQRIVADADRRLAALVEKRVRAALPEDYPWPGNVRELEQCIRRICLTGSYSVAAAAAEPERNAGFRLPACPAEPNAQQLMQHYCRHLYAKHRSYEAVAAIVQLDRRTVKKYIVG